MGKSKESGKGKLVYFNIVEESKEWEFANNGTDNFSKWVKDKIREYLGISEGEKANGNIELSETIKQEIKTQIQEALKGKVLVQTEKPEIVNENGNEIKEFETKPKTKINKFLNDICQSSD